MSVHPDHLDRVRQYLERLGFSPEEQNDFVSAPASLSKLRRLVQAHLSKVPFENLDQHRAGLGPTTLGLGELGGFHVTGKAAEFRAQPSAFRVPEALVQDEDKVKPAETQPACSTGAETCCSGNASSAKEEGDVESCFYSSSVMGTFDKVVARGRGGFCFELNSLFCWLLNALGYDARLQPVHCKLGGPSWSVVNHTIVLVHVPHEVLAQDDAYWQQDGDDVREDSAWTRQEGLFYVDVGFTSNSPRDVVPVREQPWQVEHLQTKFTKDDDGWTYYWARAPSADRLFGFFREAFPKWESIIRWRDDERWSAPLICKAVKHIYRPHGWMNNHAFVAWENSTHRLSLVEETLTRTDFQLGKKYKTELTDEECLRLLQRQFGVAFTEDELRQHPFLHKQRTHRRQRKRSIVRLSTVLLSAATAWFSWRVFQRRSA